MLHAQGLAASLLVHDSPAVKLGDPAGRARLSTLGCTMLATVLRLPKVLHPSPFPWDINGCHDQA